MAALPPLHFPVQWTSPSGKLRVDFHSNSNEGEPLKVYAQVFQQAMHDEMRQQGPNIQFDQMFVKTKGLAQSIEGNHPIIRPLSELSPESLNGLLRSLGESHKITVLMGETSELTIGWQAKDRL